MTMEGAGGLAVPPDPHGAVFAAFAVVASEQPQSQS